MDSFDTGDRHTRWITNGTALTVAAGLHGNSLHLSNDFAHILFPPEDQDDVFIVGMNYIVEDGFLDGSANNNIVSFRGDGGATYHISLTAVEGGALRVRRGDGNDAIIHTTGVGILTIDKWHHIGMKVTLHDSAGTIDVWVDGVNVISLTGQDTKNGGTGAVFDDIMVQTTSSNPCKVDDFYVCNSQGSINNDFLGVCRVNPLFPNADAATEEWSLSAGSDSFALVDEPDPNDDTDYIFSDVPAEITQFGLQDLTDLTAQIFGLQVTGYARKDDAGDASFRMGVESDGNTEVGADHVLSESYDTYFDVFELDPDGDVAWTPAQVNALEAFVEVRT